MTDSANRSCLWHVPHVAWCCTVLHGALGTKTGTANPVWNESVTIPQVENLDAKLVVTVCNKRAMGR